MPAAPIRTLISTFLIQYVVVQIIIIVLWNVLDETHNGSVKTADLGGLQQKKEKPDWPWMTLGTTLGAFISLFLPPCATAREREYSFFIAGFMTLLVANYSFIVSFQGEWRVTIMLQVLLGAGIWLLALGRRGVRRYDPTRMNQSRQKYLLGEAVSLACFLYGVFQGLPWSSAAPSFPDLAVAVSNAIFRINFLGVVLLRRGIVENAAAWAYRVIFLAGYTAVGASTGCLLSSNVALFGENLDSICQLIMLVSSVLLGYVYVHHILFYIPWNAFPFLQPRP